MNTGMKRHCSISSTHVTKRKRYNEQLLRTSLGGELPCERALTLADDGLRLDTQDTTAPTTTLCCGIIVLRLGQINNLIQLRGMLLANIRDDNCRRGLLVYQVTQTSLALDDHVGHIHLAAQRRQPQHQLDGINVVCDHNQLRLTVLNQSSDVVDTILDHARLLGVVSSSTLGFLGGSSCQTLLLVLHGLGAIVSQQLEQVSGCKQTSTTRKCEGDINSNVRSQ